MLPQNRKWLYIKEIWSKDGSNYFNDDSPDDDMDFDDDEESDKESEFPGIEDAFYALTNDNGSANGNDPLNFIYQFSQEQRKFESFVILRTGHELGISSHSVQI